MTAGLSNKLPFGNYPRLVLGLHPVPLDMNTLTALKRSTLGLDLYLWLVYRTFSLRAPQRLSWALTLLGLDLAIRHTLVDDGATSQFRQFNPLISCRPA